MESKINEIFLKRSELLQGVYECENAELKKKCIEKNFGQLIGTDLEVEEEIVAFFWRDFQRRWQSSQRKKDRFVRENDQWLRGFITVGKPHSTVALNKGGRPQKIFGDCSERSKRRKTETLRTTFSEEELSFAVKSVTNARKKKFGEYAISDEHALAIYVDSRLSARGYEIYRTPKPAQGIYPPYKHIISEKRKCYPEEKSFCVTETSCRVDLQALLNHTSLRLIQQCHEKIEVLAVKKDLDLTLQLKWGCDGSTGHNEYNQKFSDVESSDANMFISTAVPLKLSSEYNTIWKNPRPSSTRYCRPIHMQCIKETLEVTLAEQERIQEQIKNLEPFKIKIAGHDVTVKFELFLTMIDGKIVNALTNTSSAQRCYLCRATISLFNDIETVKKRPVIDDFLKYGMSSLHCWIRTFEYLLHVAYRKGFKRWFKTGHEEEYNNEKKRIQKEFFEKLGLHVDKPRVGSGNSNNGNTARKFFENAEISAAITGIDVGLIKRFHTILIVISSGNEIDIDKYREYALETAHLCTSLYPWYNMPTTVHKILIHGHLIIENCIMPIGLMSEESQEAINKEVRRLRKDNARKCSREDTIRDVFNGLLIASDPVISSYRHGTPLEPSDYPEEVLELFKKPEFPE